MFFLIRYCKMLEEGSFRGRSGDFFYMLLLGATGMVVSRHPSDGLQPPICILLLVC